ncbi:hypothetical protein [Chromatium okenii]|jgi:hypothetical protein|uniref:hypothetical protein n=1 Tax=Chromatium okenii TaxID=61644 RepID=UPI0026ED597D|nr:hypothetical protein [Chromatium okenii]MBV5308510.1 hypothetical protein [Chromatium okenii]
MLTLIVINIWYIMLIAILGYGIAHVLGVWLVKFLGLSNLDDLATWAQITIFAVSCALSWALIYTGMYFAAGVMSVWAFFGIVTVVVIGTVWAITHFFAEAKQSLDNITDALKTKIDGFRAPADIKEAVVVEVTPV